ncbi:hypothetical protein ABZX75_30365 [Streptomyces sp. NPDC003038]|uniref:hypothetical protein n=1 Tax=unclassified Streptomyces TaxID=2593676 RepID=UPI0033A0EA56
MARTHRFHVDLEGHSVTVLLEWPGHEIEVLVDGKVVAYRRKPERNGTLLHAELPTDPPQPLTILVEDMGDTPFCSLVTPDARYRRFLMPEVPWKTHESRRRLPRRSLRRLVRQLLRRLRRFLRRLRG